MIVNRDWLVERIPDSASNGRYIVTALDVAEHQYELVGAETREARVVGILDPSEPVAGAQASLDALGGDLQYRVAHRLTKRLADLFEAVDVDAHDGESALTHARIGNSLVKCRQEGVVVDKPGPSPGIAARRSALNRCRRNIPENG